MSEHQTYDFVTYCILYMLWQLKTSAYMLTVHTKGSRSLVKVTYAQWLRLIYVITNAHRLLSFNSSRLYQHVFVYS